MTHHEDASIEMGSRARTSCCSSRRMHCSVLCCQYSARPLWCFSAEAGTMVPSSIERTTCYSPFRDEPAPCRKALRGSRESTESAIAIPTHRLLRRALVRAHVKARLIHMRQEANRQAVAIRHFPFDRSISAFLTTDLRDLTTLSGSHDRPYKASHYTTQDCQAAAPIDRCQ